MECHILVDCKKVNPEIKEAVRYIIEVREKPPENTTGKKRTVDEDQKTLEEFFETRVLSQEKKAKIETSLIKLFVCCGLSWRLIEHPFFVEFVKQLHSSYDPPNRKTLAGTLLDDEILRVNTKIYRMLEKQNNLTLGKYFFYINLKLHYLLIYIILFILLYVMQHLMDGQVLQESLCGISWFIPQMERIFFGAYKIYQIKVTQLNILYKKLNQF